MGDGGVNGWAVVVNSVGDVGGAVQWAENGIPAVLFWVGGGVAGACG